MVRKVVGCLVCKQVQSPTSNWKTRTRPRQAITFANLSSACISPCRNKPNTGWRAVAGSMVPQRFIPRFSSSPAAIPSAPRNLPWLPPILPNYCHPRHTFSNFCNLASGPPVAAFPEMAAPAEARLELRRSARKSKLPDAVVEETMTRQQPRPKDVSKSTTPAKKEIVGQPSKRQKPESWVLDGKKRCWE